MRPIKPSDFAALAATKPIILLDWATGADSLANEASKVELPKCVRELPLEIWNMIVKCGLQSMRTRRYCLAQPRLVMTNKHGEDVLLCRLVEKNSDVVFGDMKTHDDIQAHDAWLARPDAPQKDENGMLSLAGRPFDITDRLIKISARLLSDLPKYALMDIDAPAIIAKFEGGLCGFCGGEQSVITGEGSMKEISWEYTEFSREGRSAWCPVCLGLEWSLKQLQMDSGEYEWSDMEDEDEETMTEVDWERKEIERRARYDSLEGERKKELGYW